MGKILVFAEFSDSHLKKGTLELLTAAKASGNEIGSVILGPGCKALGSELGHYGANQVYFSEDTVFSNYNPEIYEETLKKLIQEYQPQILLASSSALGRDLFPRLASQLSSGVSTDCTELTISGDSITAKRSLYAGKVNVTVGFENSSVKMVLMRPNQLPVGSPDTNQTAQLSELSTPAMDLKTFIKDVVKGASEKLDLTEANIIVSGGRGLKDEDHFKKVEALADVLGATVGASRAIVDAGWVPHSMQVGQTGKTVAPSLYIACGISGAIQHLAGMSDSKVIVAINKDPEAPIFKKATYGIVGDALEILPILTEEFKKIL